ncbi:MAG: hypothetical protein NT005_03535, partial [Spirochaetes bacterium]|nr:hypothetical protein [Spirochaetota bacterium]
MMRNVCRALLLVTLCAISSFFPGAVAGQVKAPFSLVLTPGVQLPLGPLNTDGSRLYTMGASASLNGELAIPPVPMLSAVSSIAFTLVPTVAQTTLSLISIGVGPMITLSLFPRFDVHLSALGGYSVVIYHTRTEGTPFLGGEAKALYSLTQSLALGVGASYQYQFGVYNGFGFFLGGSYRMGIGPSRVKTEFKDVEFEPVYPVFSKYYDDHPVGRLILRNSETGPIKNVKVSFMVPQYMVKPKVCATVAAMRPGEEKPMDLFALFTDNILSISEDTKVDAQILVEYTYMDSLVSGDTGITLRIYNRNAMTWDDDRKAAAFVTGKDPEVMKFSKAVAGGVRERGAIGVNVRFREAMGLFQSLKASGVNYVPDPTGSFLVRHDQKTAIDYLQFPIQTLQYKAGDCDDLSICYCALLETTGTESAFITVPGHIFMAFNMDMDPEEARKAFSRPDDLIFKDDKTWVPVEITMIREGFLAAWQTGAKEWRESNAAGTARFYTIQEARTLFEPVAFAGIGITAEPVRMDLVIPAYDAELER